MEKIDRVVNWTVMGLVAGGLLTGLLLTIRYCLA